jgi:D-lactate dehydrogenase (cytochrome)
LKTKNNFKELKDTFLNELNNIVGENGYSTNKEVISPYLNEQRGFYKGNSELLIKPQDTNQLSIIVTKCNFYDFKIVPIGGNTGLSGGGVPSEDGSDIIISLERMNKIRNIDKINYNITAEAGCILSNIKTQADNEDCFFPLGLASEGSCQIGGNLATNAGGINVLRYGNTRELVLGIEVVLPDGKIWNGLRALEKDNMGYPLKQLFIGSEGTLGLITAATLKLFPKQIKSETILCATNNLDNIIKLLNLTKKLSGEALSAFELLSNFAITLCKKHFTQTKFPLENKYKWYALIELSTSSNVIELRKNLESVFAEALEKNIIENAIISQNQKQSHNLWKIRELISNAQKLEGGSIKHDVSIPINSIPYFIENGIEKIKKRFPGTRPCPFGHIGDGNIHFNISQPEQDSKEKFLNKRSDINKIVYDLVAQLNGSISAEHGIGLLKTNELENYRSKEELDLMHKIKNAIDPKGIMNPNKVLKKKE